MISGDRSRPLGKPMATAVDCSMTENCSQLPVSLEDARLYCFFMFFLNIRFWYLSCCGCP